MSLRTEYAQFLIAGTNSGSGKTTLTLGILRALTLRGLAVAPFKCGPDYIDPLFHTRAAGRPSINCDTFLAGIDGARRGFRSRSAPADVAVVEGVMGLFDGDAGSSAELAAALELPVVLTINARGMAGSIAPLVKGFSEWNPVVRIVGVIANNVGSDRHAALLRDSLECNNLPPLLGFLKRDGRWALPERHLGLSTGELEEGWLDSLAEAVETSVELDRLLALCRCPRPERAAGEFPPSRLRLGVARDEAFLFYYEENFELLRRRGVEVVAFSPLHDRELPAGIQGLWLGGGYPELYAAELSGNTAMLNAIRHFAASGRPVYGECGGYLYLLDSLAGFDGISHPLLGLLPGKAAMNHKLAALGYRELEIRSGSPFGPAGTRLRGHEFHYSSCRVAESDLNFLEYNTLSGESGIAGTVRGSVFGSYMHVHGASNPAIFDHLIREMER